jgi:hypothetical protein
MAEPRKVCLSVVAIQELHRHPGRPNQLLRLPPPSALHNETRPYEVFEKDNCREALFIGSQHHRIGNNLDQVSAHAGATNCQVS